LPGLYPIFANAICEPTCLRGGCAGLPPSEDRSPAALPAQSDRFLPLGRRVEASHISRVVHRIFSLQGRTQCAPMIVKEQVR
jgi:hypothetical protein